MKGLSRRVFLKEFFAFSAALGIAGPSKHIYALKNEKKPNIIFLLTDDQAYTAMGCYGNKQVKTPNMDKLGQAGVIFDRHYDTTSICMASRASIMTGMYEYKTGCNFMHGPLSRKLFEKSYPILLKHAGYRVGFAGKFGFSVREDPTDSFNYQKYEDLPVKDFEWWAGGPGQTKYETAMNQYIAQYAEKYPHSSRAYGAAAQDFIKESKEDGRPFCLSISFKAPHMPFTPDPFFDNVYEGVTFEKPVNYGPAGAEHLAKQGKLGRQYTRLFRAWSDEKYQDTFRKYLQLIYGVDYAIGMIRNELEKQGLAENTIIILTSDNGYSCGSHGLGGKVLLYEEPCRAPLIIYDPRSPLAGKGLKSSAVTGNIDLAPTILDIAGLAIPGNMDGVSLLPIVKNPEKKVREVLPIIQAWGSAPTQSLGVVSKGYKYIYWFYAEGMEPTEELFDLGSDPYEMKNLAGVASYNKQLIRMRSHYDKVVEDWKNNAVAYSDYQQYGVLFDRTIPWAKKKDLIPEVMLKAYETELNFIKKGKKSKAKSTDKKPS
jgi:arylsulfatase A-like enzyme